MDIEIETDPIFAQNLKETILVALSTQPDIGLAILFGSLAVGKGRVESDLDLAVDAGHRLTAGEKMALISELAGRTGRPVDLVDIRAIGEPLLGQILRHGKRILGSDTHYANLIRRHLFDQADYPAIPQQNPRRKEAVMDREVIEQKLGTLRSALPCAAVSNVSQTSVRPPPKRWREIPISRISLRLTLPWPCVWILAHISLPAWKCRHRIRWAKPSMSWLRLASSMKAWRCN